MDRVTLFCFFLVTFQCIKGQEESPCDTARVILDQHRRSSNYTAGDDGESESDYMCDAYINQGWYILDSVNQGQEMPTSPPGLGKCGTHFPIWLNGTFPTEDGEVVERKACSQGLTNSCYVWYNIKIAKCQERYAYYLFPTQLACPEAYCIGNQVPCPEGESSPNKGFTPGCTNDGFPVLNSKPTISYEVGQYDVPVDNEEPMTFREVVMLCNVLYNGTENIVLDVEWIMGGIKVLTQTSIPYDQMPAKLREDDWSSQVKLDNTLRCEVAPKYPAGSVPGPTVRSDDFYMGFEVDELLLIVEEGGPPANYTISPTIPILCPVGFESCKLHIDVQEPHVGGEPVTCRDRTKLKQTAVDFPNTECVWQIPMVEDIDETTAFSLKVTGAADGSYDGTQEVRLVLQSLPAHQFHPIWQDYKLPEARVTVMDKDPDFGSKFCTAKDDPHMKTMDGRLYDMMLEGEFILYRHKSLPIEVQAYFKAAVHSNGNAYSDVCGAAVRSGGDLFIYDKCREGESDRMRLTQCDDSNLAIEDDGEGNINIELPHGGIVYLTSSTITIQASQSDFKQIDGLCGNFDLECGNDFVTRGGREMPDRCSPNPDCSDVGSCNYADRMDAFALSWRVNKTESLYQGTIGSARPTPDIIYCSCSCDINGDVEPDMNSCEKEGGTPKTSCQISTDLQFCIAGINRTDDWQEQCKNRYSALSSGVGSDDVIDEVGPFEYDPDFNPPRPEWQDPWDEPTARAECEGYIQAIQGLETCLTVPNIDTKDAIDMCIEDIRITGSTDFNKVHASGILSSCLNEIFKNMSYYSFDEDTGTMIPPYDMTKDVCTTQCLNNGTCVNGTCQCPPGYFGVNCFLDENKVPELYNIPGGGMCDIRARPCQQTPVTGNYFLNRPTLSCHITPILVTTSGDNIAQDEVKTTAAYDHYERVMCPLPLVTIDYDTTDLFTTGYIVSISNDGATKSDSRNLITYDTVCMQCTANFSCNQLAETCFIDTSCYASGQSAPTDPCNVCDPDLTSSEWTPVTTGECNTDMSSGAIAGITVLVVASAATVTMGTLFVMKKKKRTQVGDMSAEMETVSSGNLKQEEES